MPLNILGYWPESPFEIREQVCKKRADCLSQTKGGRCDCSKLDALNPPRKP